VKPELREPALPKIEAALHLAQAHKGQDSFIRRCLKAVGLGKR
jgi:hypothetical protein